MNIKRSSSVPAVGFGTAISTVLAAAATLAVSCGKETAEGDADIAQIRSPLAQWKKASPDVDFASGQLIVGFRANAFSVRADGTVPIEPEEVAALHTQLQAEASRLAARRGYTVLDTSPVLRTALMALPAEKSVVAEAEAVVAAAPSVSFAEPNGIRHASLTEPSDPQYPAQAWVSEPSTAAGLTWVGFQRAMDLRPIDFTVRVAVIDTGYRFDDPDAHTHVSQTDDYDFVRGDLRHCRGMTLINRDYDGQGPDPDATDDMQATCNGATGAWSGATISHGTAMANIIAAGWSNGQDGTGVVGRVEEQPDLSSLTLIPIKALDVIGQGTDYDIAQAITYAAGLRASNGRGGTVRMTARADIASMSLAGPAPPSIVQQVAVSAAAGEGLLMVAAAGNTANNQVVWPAGYSQVMGVSGFLMPNVAPGNFGPWVDVAGPWQLEGRRYDYSACPVQLFQLPQTACDVASGGVFGFGPLAGSSVATAVVSGIAALYKAHDDSRSGADLRTLLVSNAADVGTPGQDLLFGRGLVQAAPGRGVDLVMNRGPMRVSAIDAASGEVASTVFFGPGTTRIQIPGVDLTVQRHYYLVVATDEDGDGKYGETGEAIGAFGGEPQTPGTVEYLGEITLTRQLSLVPGFPSVEPPAGANSQPTSGGRLFVNHYVAATMDSLVDVDYFRVLVPHDGNYRIWTEGLNTILCNPVLGDYDVLLTLDPGGGPVSVDNNGTSVANENFCAEMTLRLSAGEYFLRVEPSPFAPVPTSVGASVIVHFDEVF